MSVTPAQASVVTVKGVDGFYWSLALEGSVGIEIVGMGFTPYLDGDGAWDFEAVGDAIITSLSRVPSFACGYAELFVFNRHVRGYLLNRTITAAPVIVMNASQCIDTLATYAAAVAHVAETMQPALHPDFAPVTRVRTIEVHTDGSAGRSAPQIGYGWIADNGRFGFGTQQGSDAYDGELWAMARALEGLQRTPSDRLIIRADSQVAVDTAAGITSGRLVVDGYAPSRRKPLRVIQRMCRERAAEGMTVQFEWVKGHNGHAENDIADRLAVLGRRAHEANLYPSDARDRARAIVADLDLAVRPHLVTA